MDPAESEAQEFTWALKVASKKGTCFVFGWGGGGGKNGGRTRGSGGTLVFFGAGGGNNGNRQEGEEQWR